jgi:CubicO group peptidase (beta-lactamase class C family)
MISRHLITSLLFFGILLPAIASAQSINEQDGIDSFVIARMQQKHIPAVQLAVVRHGKIIKQKTYGIANLEHGIPATDKSIFSINSITKAFIGVAVMQLAEEGKLKISDPLSMHIDSLPPTWRELTIQQVLTHTSGLPDILDANEQVLGDGDEKQAIKQVKSLPLEFKAGDKFRYNQTGYVLLGQIITRRSGMHFTKFIEERQFKAAGMQLTRFGDSYDVIPNSAGQYTMTRFVAGEFVRNQTPGVGYMQFPLFFRTAAGILSTASEMANWIIALQGGRLLQDQKSLETMWTPAVLNNGNIGGFNALTNGYALGWPTVSRMSHPALGPVGGGRSALLLYRHDDLSIIVLTNLMGSNPEQFIDELAGQYIPDMRESNGFGLSPAIQKLRVELLKQGFNTAAAAVDKLKKEDPTYKIDEKELNAWGYKLLGQKKPAEALAVFRLNASLYPRSANAYDSLGEILELLGEKKEAILNYQKSLQLDRENSNAANRIKILLGK